MSATRRISLVTGLALAAAAACSGVTGWGSVAWWLLPALALAVAATELLVVHVPFRRQRWTFSLTEGVIGAAYVIAPGGWVALPVAIGTLIAQGLRRQSGLKAAFNVALFALSAAAGAAVTVALGRSVAAACAGLATFWAVNTVLVAVPISMMSGQPIRATLRESVSLSTLQETATSSIGVLAGWLAIHAPAGLLGLAAPVGLLLVSYDETTAKAAEARLFAELAHAGEQTLDVAAQVVLTAAARLLGEAAVSLVVVGPDGPVRYDIAEDGLSRARTQADAFDAPAVLAALPTGLASGVEEGAPYVAAVVADSRDGQPAAVLVATRAQGAEPFGRHDLGLARLLVQHCGAAIGEARLVAERDAARHRVEAATGSARALGDIGAATAPALGVLRDSAVRLASLARSAGPGDVSGIVEELHEVERAVASLLGAVALASDPELALTGMELTGERTPVAENWTTTGVYIELEV